MAETREPCVYCGQTEYEPGWGCHGCGTATAEDVTGRGLREDERVSECPNFPPCGHSALMHDVSDDASGYVCRAVNRVPDDRAQRYVEARCPCGRVGA